MLSSVDKKVDLVICLSTLSLFSNQELYGILREMQEIISDEGFVLVNFHSTELGYEIYEKDGMYTVPILGKISYEMNMNLFRSKQEVEELMSKFFKTIKVLETVVEIDEERYLKMYYYIGKK